MNWAELMKGRGRFYLLVAAAFALAVTLAYAQLMQVRGMVAGTKHIGNNDFQVSHETTLEASSDTKEPEVTVEQNHSQSGDGSVNDSSSTVDVSNDGSSVNVSNRNHQVTNGGSNNNHTTTTVTVNGQTKTVVTDN